MYPFECATGQWYIVIGKVLMGTGGMCPSDAKLYTCPRPLSDTLHPERSWDPCGQVRSCLRRQYSADVASQLNTGRAAADLESPIAGGDEAVSHCQELHGDIVFPGQQGYLVVTVECWPVQLCQHELIGGARYRAHPERPAPPTT